MSNRTVQENLDLLIQTKLNIKDAINSRGGTINASTSFNEYSVLIDELPADGGRNWGQIGYNSEPAEIGQGFDYAKYIIGHLDEYPGISEHSLDFSGDTSLVYLPSCEKLGVDKNDISVFNFNGCINLEHISDDYFNTEKVNFNGNIFLNCKNLKKIPIINISNGFTGFNSPFKNLYNLEIIDPSNNIENWYSKYSGFNTTDGYFRDCLSLKKLPVIDLKNSIKATGVGTYNHRTSIRNMFYGCRSLTDVSIINTSHITNMEYMFYGCSSLTNIPLLDTLNVSSMSYMFYGCSSLTNIPLLDTLNVTNMSNMFYGCESLISIPQLDTQNVTNMPNMFTNSKLQIIEGLDFKSILNEINSNIFGSYNETIRKMYIKNIGYSSCPTYNFSNIRNWGINNSSIPDASLSIYKSLVEDTSFRAEASSPTVNIKLDTNVLSNLDNTIKAAICIKGYTLNGTSYTS